MVEQGWPAGLQSPRQYEALASQLCGAAELAALRQGHRVEIGPAQILGALRARRDLQPKPLGFADRAGGTFRGRARRPGKSPAGFCP